MNISTIFFDKFFAKHAPGHALEARTPLENAYSSFIIYN